MSVKAIKIFGQDEVLGGKSELIENIDQEVIELINDMRETVTAANGVGIAAPQIGILKRVILVHNPDTKQILEIINPEILESKGRQIGYEGCLSVPGKFGKVKRPYYLRVSYQDTNGEFHEIIGKSHLARILSHEIDHLNGEIFVNKVISWKVQ